MATVATTGVRSRTAVIGLGSAAVIAAAGALFLTQHHSAPAASSATTEQAAATPAPPPPWTGPQLRDLLDAVKASEQEGLRPSDYKLDALQQAADQGKAGGDVDAMADAAARALAHDYAAGRIRNRHRFNWYIDYTGPDASELGALVSAARQRGDLKTSLAGLLPTNPQYAALRNALAATSEADPERRDRIRANMERWRWLPRDFGRGDQLYVNLPTYRLDVVRGGDTVASYRAVIGATDMPTPALSSTVRQVIANPDWIVPQSIVRKSHLRPGASSRYEFSTRPDGGLRVRQKPGPGNALGKVKIEFPNKLAIYFHDTPSRSLFGASARAFSHGCVRVQNIEALAASIVPDQERLASALAGTSTRRFRISEPLHANIVYLTLVPGADGALTDVGDPYTMDEPLAAALAGRKPAAKVPARPPAAAPVPSRTAIPAPTRSAPARAVATKAATEDPDDAVTLPVQPEPAAAPAATDGN